MNKKGQSGSGAASLILVIVLIIIFYILFLPTEERRELLKGEYDEEGNKITTNEGKNHTLLLESVGRLDYLSRTDYEHIVPSVYLYSKTEADIIKEINPFYIKNGIFDKQDKIIDFKIEDLENTKDVKLSFIAKTHEGRLLIKLNGEVIFESGVDTINVPPVTLPADILKEENVLEFSVSSVGAAFWKTNEFNLQNIKITGYVTDTSSQQSRNVFELSGVEKLNLERTTLKFFAECNPADVGLLDIAINEHEVFSGIPDCGALSRPIPVADVFLNSGENNVVFKTHKGNYLIDQIKIKTELKEADSVTFYFEVNETDYKELVEDELNSKLIIRFVDDDKDKEAVLNINGHLTNIDQTKALYERNFDNWVRKGNNYVEIRPKDTLNIVELEVRLDE